MADNICKVCATDEGKYVCPRCNLLYCSVKCYQSRLHLRCSEEFYKENVLESMKLNTKNPEDVNKMKDILQRVYSNDEMENSDENLEEGDEEQDIDSDDEEDIAKRLGSVCLDDADAVWEKLTESERQEFVNFLQNGGHESVVPIWVPWWTYRKPQQMVEEVRNEADNTDKDYEKKCPSVRIVPPLINITKKTPAACTVWNVINVIGSYVYVMRYFNGEPLDFISEVISLLISLSGNLNKNQNFDSYEEAVEGIVYEVLQRPFLDGSENSLARMRDDIQLILHGPEESNKSYYLQAALSDIADLMEKGKSIHKKGNTKDSKNSFSKRFMSQNACQPVSKDTLKHTVKKVEYFLSWVKSCDTGV